MTRASLVAIISVVVACKPTTTVTAPDASPAHAPDIGSAGSGYSCPGECDPQLGSCACDPANGGSDCATGCCDLTFDADGNSFYGCVAPGCSSDGDCETGEICFADASCGQRACGCPGGIGPDPDQPCCLVANSRGVCCTSGELTAGGACACLDPQLTDRGNGCECADGMTLDESGQCVCADDNATFDPELGTCSCNPGTQLYVDPYTGESSCSAQPEPCADPHAVVDPSTGECECEPGFILGDTLETVSAACVPLTCGDDICEPEESCSSCSYDCGPCEGGADAGVPDGPSDASPSLDAMPTDDAMPIHDASCGSNASAVGCQ